MAGDKPLTAEREADLRATVERGYPILAETAREIFGELDRLRSELAGARRTTEGVAFASNERMKAMNRLQGELASAREAALREALAKCRSQAEAADTLGSVAAAGAHHCVDAILALINTPPAGPHTKAGEEAALREAASIFRQRADRLRRRLADRATVGEVSGDVSDLVQAEADEAAILALITTPAAGAAGGRDGG